MDNKTIIDLCQQIYKNHRLALDLIWEHAGGPAAAVLAECNSVLEKDTRWSVLNRSSRYLDFLPKGWTDWLPTFVDEDYPFCISLRAKDTDLGYVLFVGPMEDAAQRTAIIERLREDGPNLGLKRSKAFSVRGKWNRVSAVERILEWGEDDEPDSSEIREKVKKTLDSLYEKTGRLEALLKPLCASKRQG
jgi:hypothetical protein